MRNVRGGLVAALTVAVLTVAGCGAASSDTTTASGAADEAPAATTADDLLGPFGLAGRSTVEVIDALDRTQDDRAQGLAGSVGYDTLTLSAGDEQVNLPLDEDLFYLSVAPYVRTTHECFYHNLAGCQGELVGEDMDVTITTTSGEVLVDESVTTYDNGFVGFWLPRGIEGTIRVTFDGLTAESPIGTGEDDPTCLTTLQLS